MALTRWGQKKLPYLIDSEGEAIAYIDAADADRIIYLWDGTPVGYLDPVGEALVGNTWVGTKRGSSETGKDT